MKEVLYMDKIECQEKYETQTKELYAAIGKFTVKFEHVCHAMSNTILWALQSDGLRTQRLANAVLTGLTADPLRKIFGSVLAEVRHDDEQDKEIVKNVLKRVQELTESRNNVIHRTWFVGWVSLEDSDFSVVPSWKFVNTTEGTEFRSLSYSATDFDELSAKADELADIINRMCCCLTIDCRFTNNFNVDPDKTVRRVPKLGVTT
jgi:hypothetical protein